MADTFNNLDPAPSGLLAVVSHLSNIVRAHGGLLDFLTGAPTKPPDWMDPRMVQETQYQTGFGPLKQQEQNLQNGVFQLPDGTNPPGTAPSGRPILDASGFTSDRQIGNTSLQSSYAAGRPMGVFAESTTVPGLPEDPSLRKPPEPDTIIPSEVIRRAEMARDSVMAHGATSREKAELAGVAQGAYNAIINTQAGLQDTANQLRTRGWETGQQAAANHSGTSLEAARIRSANDLEAQKLRNESNKYTADAATTRANTNQQGLNDRAKQTDERVTKMADASMDVRKAEGALQDGLKKKALTASEWKALLESYDRAYSNASSAYSRISAAGVLADQAEVDRARKDVENSKNAVDTYRALFEARVSDGGGTPVRGSFLQDVLNKRNKGS